MQPNALFWNWVTVIFHRAQNGHESVTSHTLANISKYYWVMQATKEIWKAEIDCNRYRIRRAKATVKMMAPFQHPHFALPLKAFSRCAGCFGGSFITIHQKWKKLLKHYLCLFTCLCLSLGNDICIGHRIIPKSLLQNDQ